MANVILPMLVSMLLGKTIDLTSYTIGEQLYDDSDYEETQLQTVNHTYSILKENNGLPYDDIGYPVDITLRIKGNNLKSQTGYDLPVDKLLSSKYWYTKTSAVVGATSKIMTVKRSLRNDAKPLEGWKDSIPDTQTHYVSSIIYGGLNYFFDEYECFTPEDAALARKLLHSKMGKNGEINNKTVEIWIEVSNEIFKHPEMRKECNYHTYTQSTFDIRSVYYPSKYGLLKTMSRMPEAVGDVGVPIFMEMTPLHKLDKKFPAITANHKFDSKLDELAEMHDDIKKTYSKLLVWKRDNPKTFNDDDKKKFDDFEEHMKTCHEKFKEIESQISIFKKLNSSIWKSAVKLYKSKLKGKIRNYLYLFIDLRQDIAPDCKNTFLKDKIKGLLDVRKNEKKVQKVKTLKQCKKACVKEPQCVAIGTGPGKKCFNYFRGSATRNVTGSRNSAVYNRDCEFSYLYN